MPCANNDNRKPLKEVSIQETLSHAHTHALAHKRMNASIGSLRLCAFLCVYVHWAKN